MFETRRLATVLAAALARVLHPPHLRRTGTLALVVGTWLTLYNQGGVIWAGEMGAGLWVKVALNYLTPLVVANLGLLSSTRQAPDMEDAPATGE